MTKYAFFIFAFLTHNAAFADLEVLGKGSSQAFRFPGSPVTFVRISGDTAKLLFEGLAMEGKYSHSEIDSTVYEERVGESYSCTETTKKTKQTYDCLMAITDRGLGKI